MQRQQSQDRFVQHGAVIRTGQVVYLDPGKCNGGVFLAVDKVESILAIRLMCSLLYLKHAYNLSDEEVCERWAENVVWQYFSGMDYYQPRLP